MFQSSWDLVCCGLSFPVCYFLKLFFSCWFGVFLVCGFFGFVVVFFFEGGSWVFICLGFFGVFGFLECFCLFGWFGFFWVAVLNSWLRICLRREPWKLLENWYHKLIGPIIEVFSWKLWNQISNSICLGFSSGEKERALLFLSVITALKINDFAPCCRPVYIALATTQLFFFGCNWFFYEEFSEQFQTEIFSLYSFISYLLPGWFGCQCSALTNKSLSGLRSPVHKSQESQTNPAVMHRSLLHSFIKACWLCSIPQRRQAHDTEDSIFCTQEK